MFLIFYFQFFMVTACVCIVTPFWYRHSFLVSSLPVFVSSLFLMISSLPVHKYIADIHAGLDGEQSRAMDNHLALGQSHEMGKSRRHAAARLVEQGVEGTDKGVVTIIYIVLVVSRLSLSQLLPMMPRALGWRST